MSVWRPCSSCKKPIAHGAKYHVCSVSTCNRARSGYVFCSVACWDSHVPVMNHRDAWCEERRAPREGQEEAAPAAAHEPQRRLVTPAAPEPEEKEILIIASRLKDYISNRDGMNTSADVMEVLSDIVRSYTDAAMERARAEGRKTVKGRDFRWA